MVEDRITDPTRIAQLLASELTGMVTGPLDAVTVVDADESAAPSPDGTTAYGVAHAGERVGRVDLYPDAAVMVLDANVSDAATLREAAGVPDDDAVTVETDEELRISVRTGAAVKRAVDLLRVALDERGG